MKIAKMLSQNRRDFWADFECEGCGDVEHHQVGYDDRYFHDEVIPAMVCKKCGKSRNDLGIKEEPTATRFPEGLQV